MSEDQSSNVPGPDISRLHGAPDSGVKPLRELLCTAPLHTRTALARMTSRHQDVNATYVPFCAMVAGASP